MRVAFLSTASFGVPALEALLTSNHEVVVVVTGPDKPAGRGRKIVSTPVKKHAENAGLPILTPSSLKSVEFLRTFSAFRPEIAVVVAFRILPEAVFDLPEHGTLNIHPSLLPAYRGPAPIQWAILHGETRTAVTIFRITNRVDAGGILAREMVEIDPDETAGELAERIAPAGGRLLVSTIDRLAHETISPIPQDEAKVTRAPKLAKEDGLSLIHI